MVVSFDHHRIMSHGDRGISKLPLVLPGPRRPGVHQAVFDLPDSVVVGIPSCDPGRRRRDCFRRVSYAGTLSILLADTSRGPEIVEQLATLTK